MLELGNIISFNDIANNKWFMRDIFKCNLVGEYTKFDSKNNWYCGLNINFNIGEIFKDNEQNLQFLRWKNDKILHYFQQYLTFTMNKIKLSLNELKMQICEKLIIINENLFKINNDNDYYKDFQLENMNTSLKIEINELSTYINHFSNLWSKQFKKDLPNLPEFSIILISKLPNESISLREYNNSRSWKQMFQLESSLKYHFDNNKSWKENLNFSINLNIKSINFDTKTNYYRLLNLNNIQSKLNNELNLYNNNKEFIYNQDVKMKQNIIQRIKIIRQILLIPNEKLDFSELLREIESLFNTISSLFDNYETLMNNGFEVLNLTDAYNLEKTQLKYEPIEVTEIFSLLNSLLDTHL
jgi:hypothetical protein